MPAAISPHLTVFASRARRAFLALIAIIGSRRAEENESGYPGTRYFGEHILVHEFSHSIQGSFRRVDPALDAELEAAYRDATGRKMYVTARGAGHYAVNTLAENWTEGTQWWFWGNDPEV